MKSLGTKALNAAAFAGLLKAISHVGTTTPLTVTLTGVTVTASAPSMLTLLRAAAILVAVVAADDAITILLLDFPLCLRVNAAFGDNFEVSTCPGLSFAPPFTNSTTVPTAFGVTLFVSFVESILIRGV